MLRAREALLSDQSVLPTLRTQQLKALGREANAAGLSEFNSLIEKICRGYCRKYDTGLTARFEVEDFLSEVLILTYAQLTSFDPQVARFSTWFSACILPRVYSQMQRRVDPGWGRPQPKTVQGALARLEVANLARSFSLDQPLGESEQPFSERIADRGITGEAHLLEAQCQEYFLEAVRQLSEAEQILLRRVYVLQEAQKDIALSYGLTPAAISVRLKKIYARLAHLLGESFDSECGDTQFCEALRKMDL